MSVNNWKTILLVEDEVVVALAEKATLEKHGYAVITAHSGEQAVTAAASTPGIDLILMDIDLGKGIDGTEAARKILGTREAPLVFLSSHIEPEIVEKTEGITSYGYIVKDSGETVLLTSIKMAFRLFEARMNEKKKTGELQMSEEKYRTLVENMNDIVFAVDLEGKFTYLSPGLGRVSGYAPGDLIGKRFVDLVYPDDLPGIMEGLKKNKAGVIKPHEFRVLDRDGSVRFMRTSSRLVSHGGAVTGITGIMTDITESRRAEEELVLKSLVIDQVKEFVTITDLNGTITYVNKVQVDLFGRPKNELEGQKTNVFGENAERGPTQREILETTLRDGAWRGEVINVASDGSEHVMDCRTQVVHDTAGTVIALCGIATDVTEYRKTVEALRKSEEENRIIFDNTTLGIFLSTLDGVYLRVNPAVLRISGYDGIKEFLRLPTSRLYADSAQRDRIIRELREKGSVGNVEIRARKKDGSAHWVSLSAVILNDESGTPKNIIGFVEDITERKRAEEKIQALLTEKEILLKEVHHRIKNNMGTITSLLNLQAGRPESREAAPALQDAVSRVQSMGLLYDKLYQSSSMRDMPVGAYLPQLVEEIVSLFHAGAGIKVETEIDDFILGVKTLSPVGIIVNELVTNAMKYAFPGGGGGAIRVSASKKGKTATLAVEDDGIGLPRDFDIAKSTGFGLELVAMLARQIGGSIRVERAKGARFVLEFKVE